MVVSIATATTPVPAPAPAGFATLDWVVLIAYLGVVVVIGCLAIRRRSTGDDFFLAGRNMPVWAVAISILATSQSAATFVGGPQEAFAGDLTYLSTNIGTIIAAVLVAFVFLPAFYRHNVTSVYELIGHRIGTPAQRLTSAAFMLGRVFASGARLYIVAIPFALVAFGDIEPRHLVASIVIVTIVATAYAMAGGIRAVIWTDVLQTVVYLTCISIALVLIYQRIGLSPAELTAVLTDDVAGNKLRLFDFSFNLTDHYTVWAAAIGFGLLMIAAYGTDQDLTQRMLTCRSARRATASLIAATLITIPVVLIFLLMGLLLYIYYARPDVMGDAAPVYALDDTRRVFIDFILNDMPVGVRGLMMAGLFAAAMSSMDSGLNAMSSTVTADFIRPWRTRNNPAARDGDQTERRIGRIVSVIWAAVLAGFAMLCVYWHQRDDETIIQFALSVMTFAYSGLLGVFFTAIFTRTRGSARSAAAAMIAGFLVIAALDPLIMPHYLPDAWQDQMTFAFPWKLTLGVALSTTICLTGRRRV